jgi:methyltransferase family protein
MDIASRCICCNASALLASPAVLMPFVAKRVFGWEPVEITADWGMRDLKPGHAYSLCNTFRCSECGVLFLDMRFNDREMSALYGDYRGESYTATRERFEPGYSARNEILVAGSTYIPGVEAFLSAFATPPLRMLDWGGDTGRNTPFLGRLSLHHIYDISDKEPVAGAQLVDMPAIEATEYDLIVCSNVLEHVPYPETTIRSMIAAMSRDTVLYLEVPHEDLIRFASTPEGLETKKKHWHEHINFFTPRSLEILVNRCGLRVLGTTTLDINAGGKDAQVLALACRLS